MKCKMFLKAIVCLCIVGALIVHWPGDVQKAAAESNNSGSITDTISWNYEDTVGTLTLTGKGVMTSIPNWNLSGVVNKIVIGEGITSLSDRCFNGFNKLKSVELPSTITTIGSNAFSDCISLSAVELPKGQLKIGYGAFQNCGIKKLTISQYTNCDSYAFASCKYLTTVEYLNRSLPFGIFSGCVSLDKITFGSNLILISDYAFYNSGLKKMVVPDSVREIGGSAFAYCNALETLDLSDNISVLPYGFVDSSKNLKNLKLPSKLTKIQSYAFSGCYLSRISLPKGIKEVPGWCFSNSHIKYVSLHSGITKINANAFQNSFELIKVSIPDNVTFIGREAFQNCDALLKVSLPDKITSIKSRTFADCDHLTTVHFGKNIKTVDEYAFTNCPKLQSVSFDKKLTSIGYNSFSYTGIRKLKLANEIKYVDYWAFFRCEKLKSVTIGAKLKDFHINSFAKCLKLKSISVSKENPYYSSFKDCIYNKNRTRLLLCPITKSGTFTLIASVRNLRANAFSSCTGIKNFMVEGGNPSYASIDGVIYTKNRRTLVAFPCGRTGDFHIPKTVTRISDLAFQHSMISSVSIPTSVTTLGDFSFEYCDNITSITIPGSVHKVSNALFWGCKALRTVRLKNGVTSISRNAFYDCRELHKIVFPATFSSISTNAFYRCYSVIFYCKRSSYPMSFAQKKRIMYRII